MPSTRLDSKIGDLGRDDPEFEVDFQTEPNLKRLTQITPLTPT